VSTALIARDLVHAKPVAVPESMPYLDLQHLLVAAGIGGAPVVNARGAVVGIVTAADLLRAADEVLDPDQDPGEPDDLASRFDTLTAGDRSGLDLGRRNARARSNTRIDVGSQGFPLPAYTPRLVA
jgi:CBS domain-containing protein